MKHLTVIVPSIGRERGIQNLINFFKEKKFKNNVNIFFVFNGIKREIFDQLCKKFSAYLNSNIFFFFSKESGRFNCLKSVIKKINTPYLMLLDDDDHIYFFNLSKLLKVFRSYRDLCLISIPTQISEQTQEQFIENYTVFRYYNKLISDRKEIIKTSCFIKAFSKILLEVENLKLRVPTSLFLSEISLCGPALITNKYGLIYKGRLSDGLSFKINYHKLKAPQPMHLQKRNILKHTPKKKIFSVLFFKLVFSYLIYFILWKLKDACHLQKKFVK
jgi:hypothetical protein